MRCDDEHFGGEEFPVVIPVDSSIEYVHVVGSLNGILCLKVDFSWDTEEQIILWNPSIRKSVTLPEPEDASLFFLGFGVNPTTHEYKVVIIAYETAYRMKVEISTQGTGWRRIGSTFPNCIVEPMASQAFVNGSVNWIVKFF